MGTIKFAIQLLFRDFKKILFYCASLIASTVVVYIFFGMTANPAYGGDPSGSVMGFTSLLSIIVIIFGCVMVFFANSYYLASKTKELAIESVCGGNVLTLAGFILTQNLIIMLIAIPIGMGIGYFLSPVINSFLYAKLGVDANPWEVFPTGVIYTIITLITEMIYLVEMNTGYAYRTDLLTLISADKQMNPRETKTIKVPDIVFIILYIVPLGIIFGTEPNSSTYMVGCVIGLFGISGLLKSVLPKFFTRITENKYLDHKYHIVSLGNLNYSLKKSTTLIQMVIISAVMLMCFMCTYYNQPNQLIIIIVSYVVLIFMLGVSICYKVVMEATNRALSFKHLKMLGYVTKEVNLIIAEELFMLFALIILFPTIYLVSIVYRFSGAGMMDMAFGLKIIGFYVIGFIIAGIISYFVYKGIIKKGGKR